MSSVGGRLKEKKKKKSFFSDNVYLKVVACLTLLAEDAVEATLTVRIRHNQGTSRFIGGY